MDINYAIGKCFTCGEWLGGEKDMYCDEHAVIRISDLLFEQSWAEITESHIIPAIEDARKRNIHIGVGHED